MKRLKNLALIPGMIVMAGLLSCSKDDGDSASGVEITFDGKTYTMVAGRSEDYGPSNPADDSSSDTHYNFDLTVADAAFVQVTDTDGDIEFRAGSDMTFGVYVELFSPGTSAFQVGTFNFVDGEQSEVLSSIEGKFFFSAAEVFMPTGGVDSDGDPEFNEYEATGGTVTVTGSAPTDFVITYNLQFAGGKTLTGTYSGDFVFSDENDAG
ncbi:MAG: hypothetical protein ABJG78_20890 [Cyclobacteriaceae bacterium]